jgi:hypothetical protein
MTYSQSLTGANLNDYPFAPVNTSIPDTGLSGNVVARPALPNQTSGAMQQAMCRNDYLLCKNPDGSQSYYVLVPELSTPGNPVLRPVGP